MPSILTHYIFNQSLNSSTSLEANIGSQGPDPLFFYFCGLKNYPNTKLICEYGNVLHKMNPTSTLIYFYNYALKQNSDDKNILLNYLKGFISHYSLDSTAHPYIFYKSGFSLTDDKKEVKKYFLDHVQLESNIDVLIRNYFQYKISPAKTLKIKNDDLKIISKMYYSYFRDKFNENNFYEDTFFIALKRMRFTFKVVYSKYQIKKTLFNLFFKNHEINKFSYQTLKKCQNQDYLNLKHEIYFDATTNEQIGNYSFIDLFEISSNKYKEITKILFSNLDDDNKTKELNKLINDINFDGFKIGVKKLYFSSFFK